jgi:hypothetical protein
MIDYNENVLIEAENENLFIGLRSVFCHVLDNHVGHIDRHKELLKHPDIYTDPKAVARILDHIQEHIDKQIESQQYDLAIGGYRGR